MSRNRRDYRQKGNGRQSSYNRQSLHNRQSSQGRHTGYGGRTEYDKKRTAAGRSADIGYVDGNTVRKAEPQWETVPVRKPSHKVRKNRDRARHMSAGYVVFLVAALCAAAFILVNYIQLQARLTNLTDDVASMQSRLNYLKISNDEEYNRILSSIDLEEIKRIAMGELGMIHAEEGQVIRYSNKGNDYMRQVTESSHQRQ